MGNMLSELRCFSDSSISDVLRRHRISSVTAASMAAQLYDSLHGKLLALPDSVAVFPAHGAGSLCGRNISSETSSTIGV